MQKNEAQERLISVPDLKEVRQWTGTHNASNHSFGLVVGRFNYGLTSCLLETVVETLVEQGAEPGRIDVTWVPGSFEIPLVIKRLAGVSQYSALIALGAVVQGETPHAGLISTEVAHALASLARQYDVPVLDGVVTANTYEQAEQRCLPGPSGRGKYIALAAIEMATLMMALQGDEDGRPA